jgi:hypothetical protein
MRPPERATALRNVGALRWMLDGMVAYAGPEELLPDQLSVVRT